MTRCAVLMLLLTLFPSREPPAPGVGPDSAAAVLDDLHDAASKADGPRYFGHFTPEAVFLGTDAGERWPLAEFRAYARARFDRGDGWTYRATSRHISIGPGGRTAWFDEALINEKYGVCRGSGVLTRTQGTWKIAQYNLSIPIPNELALEVVAMIRGQASGKEP